MQAGRPVISLLVLDHAADVPFRRSAATQALRLKRGGRMTGVQPNTMPNSAEDSPPRIVESDSGCWFDIMAKIRCYPNHIFALGGVVFLPTHLLG